MTRVHSDWQTPKWLIDLIHESFDGIDLDPCTSEDNPTRAERFYTLKSPDPNPGDGWPKNGLVFCNPPYNKSDQMKYVRHFVTFNKMVNAGLGLLLLPSKTETEAFQLAMRSAQTMLFFDKRLRFIDMRTGKSEHPPRFGSALFGYMNSMIIRDVFYRTFKTHGHILDNQYPRLSTGF